jgi:dihydropteroate synthase
LFFVTAKALNKMNEYFQCGRYRFALSGADSRPLVMGILNVTPDSFSDGGRYAQLDFAVSHAEQMIADGVDIIDIGGESSRPGSRALSLQEELERVMPVIYALRDCGKPLSIDTYKPQMMREALLAGADMINDIQGFSSAEALQAVADSDCGLCVMHMQNQPDNMQKNPGYHDVQAEVAHFLRQRMQDLIDTGVSARRITVDPGFGFGKTLEHNIALAKHIGALRDELRVPVLAGLSRKTMIGQLTGKPLEQRMSGSIGGALAAIRNGARIVRVHDVAETVDAVRVWQVLVS